jgi:hypothetical protein
MIYLWWRSQLAVQQNFEEPRHRDFSWWYLSFILSKYSTAYNSLGACVLSKKKRSLLLLGVHCWIFSFDCGDFCVNVRHCRSILWCLQRAWQTSLTSCITQLGISTVAWSLWSWLLSTPPSPRFGKILGSSISRILLGDAFLTISEGSDHY